MHQAKQFLARFNPAKFKSSANGEIVKTKTEILSCDAETKELETSLANWREKTRKLHLRLDSLKAKSELEFHSHNLSTIICENIEKVGSVIALDFFLIFGN